MVANAVLTVALMLPLAHVGNALATSAAGWINAIGLLVMLHRCGHFSFDARARQRLPRIAAAALGMGVLLVLAEHLLAPALTGAPLLRMSALAALIAGGLAGFAALVLVFGAADWADLKRRLRRQAP